MVVSIIALVVACTGTGIAASSVLIHRSSQIGRGVIRGSNIASSTVTNRNLARNSVRKTNLDAGLRGLLLSAGKAPTGTSAPASSGFMPAAREAFRPDGPDNQPTGVNARVATLPGLDPGVYAIFAKTVINATFDNTTNLATVFARIGSGGDANAQCTLDAAGDKDVTYQPIASPFSSVVASMTMQITRTLGTPGDVTVSCLSNNLNWHAAHTSIIAVRLAAAPRQAVSG